MAAEAAAPTGGARSAGAGAPRPEASRSPQPPSGGRRGGGEAGGEAPDHRSSGTPLCRMRAGGEKKQGWDAAAETTKTPKEQPPARRRRTPPRRRPHSYASRATAGQRRPGTAREEGRHGAGGRAGHGREGGPTEKHRSTTRRRRTTAADSDGPPKANETERRRGFKTGAAYGRPRPRLRGHHRRLRRPVEPHPAAGGSDAGHRTAEEPPPGRPDRRTFVTANLAAHSSAVAPVRLLVCCGFAPRVSWTDAVPGLSQQARAALAAGNDAQPQRHAEAERCRRMWQRAAEQ